MSIMIEAENIQKIYPGSPPLTVLKQISFRVNKGESLAIKGKSGEGKSTLLHILGGLTDFSSGKLEVCGYSFPCNNLPLLRNQHLGFIFQFYHLLEEFSVLDNVLMPARIARQNTHKSSYFYKRAEELLELVGLSHRKSFLAKHLSGGEKQRVAIARALCNDPELILADEPSGNLDQINSESIHQLLLDLQKTFKKTVVIVTHDPELAKACDRMLILKEGCLCAS
jgi:lipoprotein-releasing system ATP-binding protein